jgi:hypothetical protein
MKSASINEEKIGDLCNQENEILLANETTCQSYFYFTH